MYWQKQEAISLDNTVKEVSFTSIIYAKTKSIFITEPLHWQFYMMRNKV